ncbi:MAG: hypothetical protein ACPGXL_07845, partial [Chitinophagales bacterium]
MTQKATLAIFVFLLGVFSLGLPNANLYAQCPTLVAVQGDTEFCSGDLATYALDLTGVLNNQQGYNYIHPVQQWDVVNFATDGLGDEGGMEGFFIRMNDDNAGENSPAYVASFSLPPMDLSAATTSELSFDLDYFHFGGSSFTVEVWDGTIWQTAYQQTASIAGDAVVNLSTYLNSDLQVRFVYDDGNGWNFGVTIDNISITSNGTPIYWEDFEQGMLPPTNFPNYVVTWTLPDGSVRPSIYDNISFETLNDQVCGATATMVDYSFSCVGATAQNAGSIALNVYPQINDFDYTIPDEIGASLEIMSNCTSLVINYSTDGGQTYSTTTPADLATDQAIEVFYTIGAANAPVGTACLATGSYVVANVSNTNCPILVNVSQDVPSVCSGDAVNLTASLANVETLFGNLIDPTSPAIGTNATGNSFTRSGESTTCTPSTFNVQYDVVAFQVTADDFYTITANFDYDGFLHLYTGGFDPNNPCENYLNGNDDNGGTLQSEIVAELVVGTTYYAVISGLNSAETGNYSLEMTSTVGAGFANVVSNSFEIAWTVNGVTETSTDFSNDFVLNHSGNGCNVETVTATYTVTCVNDGSLVASGSETINIYPSITEGVQFALPAPVQDTNAGCSLVVQDLCSTGNLAVEYSLDGQNFSTTPPSNASGGDVTTVYYSLVPAGASSNCTISGSYTVSCVDINCPTAIAPSSTSIDVCSGEYTNIGVALNGVELLAGGSIPDNGTSTGQWAITTGPVPF